MPSITTRPVRQAFRWTAATVAAVCLACGGTPVGPTSPSAVAGDAPAAIPPLVAAGPVLPTEIFVGAGDIAQCATGNPEATAKLLDSIAGTVFALGDNAYPSGSAEDYRGCYDATWGRHRSRTRPVAGNHEYDTAGAAPYYEYFGGAAGPAGLGFYSYDLGNWHIVALNSNIGAAGNSPQAAWLRNDLRAHPVQCTLAYWHYPVFSSSEHGNIATMRDVWRILYDNGADVVLGGHDHVYERFAPQDPDGAADPLKGIREFVAGTGGAPPYPFVDVKPNSEVRLSANGVLRLALKAGGYDWTFIPTAGAGDSGSASCH